MRGLSMFVAALMASLVTDPAGAGSNGLRVVGGAPSVGATSSGAVGRLMLDEAVEYVVAQGETFDTIGARLGVDPTALARRNRRWLHAPLPAGTKLVAEAHRTVPAGIERGILINVPQRMLFLLAEDGSILTAPVAAGRPDWPTPPGAFRVTVKVIDPEWDVPGSIRDEMKLLGRSPAGRVPPGPENPLGRYWIGVSLPNMGIHGTNAPSSVPGFITHGCIRVGGDKIASLFDRVAVGTPGEIIYEPTLLTRHDGRVFVEAHRDVYDARPDALAALVAAADRLGVRRNIDWPRVRQVVRLREGLAIDVTLP